MKIYSEYKDTDPAIANQDTHPTVLTTIVNQDTHPTHGQYGPHSRKPAAAAAHAARAAGASGGA
jgi:hypothetical protein